jgi:hypothetical protein
MADTERGGTIGPNPDPAAALIAVGPIGLVRGLPDKAETEAAKGGALSG